MFSLLRKKVRMCVSTNGKYASTTEKAILLEKCVFPLVRDMFPLLGNQSVDVMNHDFSQMKCYSFSY